MGREAGAAAPARAPAPHAAASAPPSAAPPQLLAAIFVVSDGESRIINGLASGLVNNQVISC